MLYPHMEDWDMDDWQSHILPGDIVVFYDVDDNSPYQYSRPGRLVRKVQSLYRDGDPSVIHVALAVGPNPEQPKPGSTSHLIIDALIYDKVDVRPLARDYKIKIFRLKEQTFTGKKKDGSPYTFTSKDIQETAYGIAMVMRYIKYGKWTCVDVVRHRATRENAELDFLYTHWLMTRFHFDTISKNISPNKDKESFMCAELVIVCYQLAWLMLADQSAQLEGPPAWMPLHAHSRPQKLVSHLEESPLFETLNDTIISKLRYSGTPHPKDSRHPLIEMKEIVPMPSRWSWKNRYQRQGYARVSTTIPEESKDVELRDDVYLHKDDLDDIDTYEKPQDEAPTEEDAHLGKMLIGRLT